MALRAFDVAGAIAVASFAAVIFADLDVLRHPPIETPLEVSAEELSEGFREGVSWYAFYIEDAKVGFSRIERQRREDGYDINVRSLFRPTVLGRQTEVGLEMRASCNRQMWIERIDLGVSSGGSRLSAHGVVTGDHLELRLEAAGMEHRTTLSLGAPPMLDLTVRPSLLANDPQFGERYAYQTFDPSSLSLRTVEIEYRGHEKIEVLGSKTNAHLLHQTTGEQTVKVWVNDLGEVLMEEMPLGIVAIRETEAEATWGLGHGTHAATAEIGHIDELLSLLGPASSASPHGAETPP